MPDLSEEPRLEAIDLPPGCWVDSVEGWVMLPGGAVIGKLTTHGLEALHWHLYDLERMKGLPDA